jgi:hypothetical protein
MSTQKQRDYDDNELVLALAAGNRSYAQIARDLGISRALVHAIAQGTKRPMLQERIRAASAAFREQGCRLAARMVGPAIGRLVHMISPGSDAPPEVQRRAAADILKFAFGSGAGPGYYTHPRGPAPVALLAALDEQLRQQVLDDLGAPQEDDDDGDADADGSTSDG